jgi:hypothetical protein
MFWNPNAPQVGGGAGGFDVGQGISGPSAQLPMQMMPAVGPGSGAFDRFQAFAQGSPTAGGAAGGAAPTTTGPGALEQVRKMYGVAPGYEAAFMANNPDFAKAVAGQQQAGLAQQQLGIEQQKFGLEQEKQKWLMSDEGKAFTLGSNMLQAGMSADKVERALENLGFKMPFGRGGAGAGAGTGAGAGAGAGGETPRPSAQGAALSKSFPKDVRSFLEDEVGPAGRGPGGKEGQQYTVNTPMDAIKQLLARFPQEYTTQNLPGLINYLVQRFPGVDVKKELFGPNVGILEGVPFLGGMNPTEELQSKLRSQLGLEQKRSWGQVPFGELTSPWHEPRPVGQAKKPYTFKDFLQWGWGGQ